MIINLSELKNVPVVTENETSLGHVADIEIDVENYLITNLVVKRGLLGKNLLINRSQIISITAQKVIVEDSAALELEEETSERQYESPSASY